MPGRVLDTYSRYLIYVLIMHACIQEIMSIYYISSTVLMTVYTVANKTQNIPALLELIRLLSKQNSFS